ncbi:MAG: DUF4199 domain-containing protein [Cytophagaceae bacterium]|nr:DUF4199 domain-containing protein [Cytophagaceae bacterium]MBL0301191.1 DUF4199 domain-containing protein [Cytophagaceae bacterium]MBL0324008.1 DUF4199 domain-containing protein [Cytophagaceae bacterium]
MKNIIIKNGLIAGTIVSLFMVISMYYLHESGKAEGSMLLGYASMLVAFSFVFIGVKKYRDTLGEGKITFGIAFKVGLGISVIASVMYTLAWAIEYHFFMPDFMENMISATSEKLKSEIKDPVLLAEKIKEIESGRDLYANIFSFLGITFSEIFPVGLLVSLVSALILKKK